MERKDIDESVSEPYTEKSAVKKGQVKKVKKGQMIYTQCVLI